MESSPDLVGNPNPNTTFLKEGEGGIEKSWVDITTEGLKASTSNTMSK